MRLFEFVNDTPDAGDISVTKTEAPVIVKSAEAPRPLQRPASDNSLFALVEQEVVVRELSPIQRQRVEDGTPHTRTAFTALRPPEPKLYLEGISKGVNSDGVKDDRANPMPVTDPDAVVKAFLDFEG